jgi:dTDP-4-amino-4,6-dideoxygalactose transaminase
MIPLIMPIPRRKINLYNGELRHIATYALSDSLRGTDFRKRFEDELKNHFKCSFVFLVSSGRAGLSLILDALDLPERSEIILPAYTDQSVPEVIVEKGFQPVFIDIDNSDHNMNSDEVVRKSNERTGAVVVTHLFGFPFNVKKLKAAYKNRSVFIIEDCSHAVGTRLDGKATGTLGDVGFISLSKTKPLNAFNGGILLTNDRTIAERIDKLIKIIPTEKRIRILKDVLTGLMLHLVTRRIVFSLTIFPVLYLLSFFRSDLAGIYRSIFKRRKVEKTKMAAEKLSNFKAFIGLNQLRYYEKYLKTNVRNASLLGHLLDKTVRRQNTNEEKIEPNYYFFNIVTKNSAALSAKLIRRGIDTGKKVAKDCSRKYASANKEKFPNTKEALQNTLQIPIYPGVKRNEIEYIARLINENYLK